MRIRLSFLALYSFCWILLFQFFRVIFFIYHYKKALEISSSYWVQSALHGLKMDISFTGYLLIIPTLLMAFTFFSWSWYNAFIKIYSIITACIIATLVTFDLELFRAWGFRIDASSLHYLQTPREALASMGAAPVGLLLTLLFILGSLSIWLLSAVRNRFVPRFRGVNALTAIIVFVLLAALWVIPIRGGLQLAPMNQASVYFSDKSFANYAAVNVPWNYAHSILNRNSYSKTNPFGYFPQKEADARVRQLYTATTPDQYLLKTSTPNVIVIIWESFTAKAVGSLGGLPNITPRFDELTKEGILFTNLYASGNRSDKGMVAILSGYPAQPTESIIKIPTKTRSLPSLPHAFKEKGYHTSFYYGGETEFANMKTYFLQQDFNKITDINSFEKKDMNSKWGAHDHVVLNRLLEDLDQAKSPFFATLFTLSSHEPFEVPVPTVIKGNSQENLFLNALHYSDESIGNFIQTAKTKPWWNNTVIVILADHGHPLPETSKEKPSEFHIPMLWLGGALQQTNIRVNILASQTDMASTLLNQLHIPANQFSWSNDIFGTKRQVFAYFAFSNGFGWMRPEGYIIRDNIGGNIVEKKGSINLSEVETGKTYLQASFNDYLNR